MKIAHLHPAKKVIFALAFLGGLVIGWIYHLMAVQEDPVMIVVATQHIEKDQRLMRDMYRTKPTSPKHLPTGHIPPENINFYVGQKAKYPIAVGEILQQHSFERNERN